VLTPTNKDIAAYARREARRAISIRRVNPAQASEIVAAAQDECERMYAAQRAAR
jgi:hypothetical protein